MPTSQQDMNPPAGLGPLRLGPNRVSRFYRGGALLDAFRAGRADPDGRDGGEPEDWVGSVTRAWAPPAAPHTDTGLSVATVDGRERRLLDLLDESPIAVAGEALVAAAGPTTGVLVKLLDAAIRLPVHAHPTRAFARRHLGSFFGKAEAWIVVGTRQVPGEGPPAVWLGFRADLERDELRRHLDGGGRELVGLLHRRAVAPGDVWFVPPGTPHAIGAGVFIVEVQEPSDFSVVAETKGFPVEPVDAHLRLGWDIAIDVFDRRGRSGDEIDSLRRRIPPAAGDGGPVALTGPEAAAYFRAVRYSVRDRLVPDLEPAFLVGVVTGGRGRVRAGGRALDVGHGDTFAIPAVALPDLVIEADGRLDMIGCLPPRPADLAAPLS